jgi:hypothetical protein
MAWHLEPGQPETEIKVVYDDGQRTYDAFANMFRSIRFLVTVAEFYREHYRWPRSFTLKMEACGHPGADYDGDARVATMCYETRSTWPSSIAPTSSRRRRLRRRAPRKSGNRGEIDVGGRCSVSQSAEEEMLDLDHYARVFSEALGRPIRYRDVPLPAWSESLRKAGLPEHLVSHLSAMAELTRQGRYDRMTDTLTGEVPTNMLDFVKLHAAEFKQRGPAHS